MAGVVAGIQRVVADHRVQRDSGPEIVTAGELDDVDGVGRRTAVRILVVAMRPGQTDGPGIPVVGAADARDPQIRTAGALVVVLEPAGTADREAREADDQVTVD